MSEGRRHPRFSVGDLPVQQLAVIAADLDADFTDLMVSNLSLGGAFVKMARPLPLGTRVSMTLPLEACGEVQAMAEVVWVREVEETALDGRPAGVGLRFTEIAPTGLVALKHFLEALFEAGLAEDDLV